MQHECRITVLETKVFPEYQEKYLADPKSGPCPCFQEGDTFLLKRTAERDDFYHLMNGKFCGEAWDAISRYVYTALQGGSIMSGSISPRPKRNGNGWKSRISRIRQRMPTPAESGTGASSWSRLCQIPTPRIKEYLMQSGALTRALRFLIVLFAGTPCPPVAPRTHRWDGRSGR